MEELCQKVAEKGELVAVRNQLEVELEDKVKKEQLNKALAQVANDLTLKFQKDN